MEGKLYHNFSYSEIDESISALKNSFQSDFDSSKSKTNVRENLVQLLKIGNNNTYSAGLNGLQLTTNGFFLTAHNVLEMFLDEFIDMALLAIKNPNEYIQMTPFIVCDINKEAWCLDPTFIKPYKERNLALLKAIKPFDCEPVNYLVNSDPREDENICMLFRRIDTGSLEVAAGDVVATDTEYHDKNSCFHDSVISTMKSNIGIPGAPVCSADDGRLLGIASHELRIFDLPSVGFQKISYAKNFIDELCNRESNRYFGVKK